MTNYIKQLILFVLVFVVLQIPMLHTWVLFGVAFPFQYIGLVILLAHRLPRGWLMVIAFFTGLLVDVFSNTPGIHASASVLVAFVSPKWLEVVADRSDENLTITLTQMGFNGFFLFVFPLILVHHLMLFALEQEGFHLFGHLLLRTVSSTLLSFFVITVVSVLAQPKKKRL